MGRFIEGVDWRQATLLPDTIEDYVGEENPVWVIDAFVDMLDVAALGFNGVIPEQTGRPSCHPRWMTSTEAGKVMHRYWTKSARAVR